jgi:hypothetical protein
MDRGQAELAYTGVGEAVGHVGRADDDVSFFDDDRLVAQLERGLPGLNDEHLRVGVPMELRTDAGPRVHEDDRERNISVLGADEFVGMPGVLQVVELDDQFVVIGQRSLASYGGHASMAGHPPNRIAGLSD